MITEATTADIPDLAELLRALHALHAEHLPERFHTQASTPELRSFFEESLGQGARVLLYRTDGVARGYLMWSLIDQPHTPLLVAQRRALLDHIAVQPICRRRGTASRLIAWFEADVAAAGCSGWVSRVHAFNAASAGLMRSAGADLSVQVFEKQLLPP